MKFSLPAKVVLCMALASCAQMGAVQAEGPGPEAKAMIQAAMAKAPAITPEELKERMASGDVVLVDVRQDSEISILGRVLPQAEQKEIPRGYIEIKTLDAITDKDAAIVAYCGKGIRSAFAANTLAEMGYTNVVHLKGGVKAWKEAGNTTYE